MSNLYYECHRKFYSKKVDRFHRRRYHRKRSSRRRFYYEYRRKSSSYRRGYHRNFSLPLSINNINNNNHIPSDNNQDNTNDYPPSDDNDDNSSNYPPSDNNDNNSSNGTISNDNNNNSNNYSSSDNNDNNSSNGTISNDNNNNSNNYSSSDNNDNNSSNGTISNNSNDDSNNYSSSDNNNNNSVFYPDVIPKGRGYRQRIKKLKFEFIGNVGYKAKQGIIQYTVVDGSKREMAWIPSKLLQSGLLSMGIIKYWQHQDMEKRIRINRCRRNKFITPYGKRPIIIDQKKLTQKQYQILMQKVEKRHDSINELDVEFF